MAGSPPGRLGDAFKAHCCLQQRLSVRGPKLITLLAAAIECLAEKPQKREKLCAKHVSKKNKVTETGTFPRFFLNLRS